MFSQKKDYREIVNNILDYLKKRSPVTDTNVGSISRTLVESISREISIMYEQMEAAYNAGFIDTAKGPALDMVVAILGVQRKSAQYATGSVTFSRRKATQDVTIPRGTRVSTVSSNPREVGVFASTFTLTLPRGRNEIEVPVRAVTPGKEGMADFETVRKLESPIIGIDKVLNKKPTTIGTERETDEELRARAKAVILSAGKTTVESIRNAVIAIPGIRGVTITDMPEGVPGEIDVIIDGLDLTDRESRPYLLVEEVIERVRPAGIRVNIRSTTIVRTEMIVFVNLTDTARTDEEADRASDSIRDSITDFIISLKCGENIIRNKLIAALFENENIDNLQDIEITTRVFDDKVGGLKEDTRKRTDERTKDIVIGESERAELENIDVRTQFSPRLVSYVQVDLTLRVIPTKKTITRQKLIEGARARLQLHFEKLRGGEEIDYRRIFNLIRSVKGISELVDLALSALHEDSGLAISDSRNNITTRENEQVKLRNVNLEIIG